MAEGVGRWRLVAGLFLLAGVMAFAVMVWFAMRGEEAVIEPREAVPIARAPETPDRERPEDPGGETVPDQDKHVYDSFRKGGQPEPVERLLPAAEAPLPEPEPETPSAPAEAEEPVETVEVEVRPEPPVETVVSDTEEQDEPASDEAASPAPVPPPAPNPATRPTAKPAAAGTGAASAAASGDWQVQLAALRDEASALATWRRIAGKQKTLLGGMAPDIVRVDTGSRGIFYRVRTGAFQTRADAEAFCASLKKAGQDCLVARK